MHIPVLAREALSFLQCRPGELHIDCTVNDAGHAEAMLDASGETGRLIGFDWDDEAIAAARERLAPFGDRVELHHTSFVQGLRSLLPDSRDSVAGVLFDIGVSAAQVERGERGMSYRLSGPLDMRMDRRRAKTARTLIDQSSWQDLARILRRYGEEPRASTIARRVVQTHQRRPIESTSELASIVTESVPPPYRKKALSRTFQALRVAVNDELQELEQGLGAVFPLLRVGGRVVVIAYHSLEDRIVKEQFRRWAAGCTCPPGLPQCVCGGRSHFRVLTRKPVRPSSEETRSNPRARSAKLRAGERLE